MSEIEKAIALFERTCIMTGRSNGKHEIPRMIQLVIEALREKQAREAPKQLTLEELKKRCKPVYVQLQGKVGFWCLCDQGYITPPSCQSFMAKDRPNWVFYDGEPQEPVKKAEEQPDFIEYFGEYHPEESE